MNENFPKAVKDFMKICIISIFWPKKDVIDFFANNGCSKDCLKIVKNNNQLSRKQIIEDVYEKLDDQTDKGLGQYRSMLKSLVEWDNFDSYFFTTGNLDAQESKNNISKLKIMQSSRDEKITEESSARRTKQYLNSKIDPTTFKDRMINLYKLKDEAGKDISTQQRGYKLEQLLRDIFEHEQLNLTEGFSYNLPGEQIDGSLKFDGENYIIEAKWQDNLTASNSLYHFSYKVEGKMYGRGIFISINGYSSDSVLALKTGKALKTILIDGEDLVQVVEGVWSMTELIDKKIKAAQTQGNIYASPLTLKEKINY